MSAHIENVKKALEFAKPDYLPMETCQVPGIYNAYHTLDPDTVKLIPGTENFDAIWPITYSWKQTEIGRTAEGESIRKDQFGTVVRIPRDMSSTYVLMEHPLAGKSSLEGFSFPDIEDMDQWFSDLGKTIGERYGDRFFDAFIDPGLFLTTQFLLGSNDFFLKLATDLDFVVSVYEALAEYYMKMVLKFKGAGAHMVTIIEDLGSKQGMVFNPETWRKRFKPIIQSVYRFIHDNGMYTGICIDGDAKAVLDDLVDMDIDQLFIPDFKVTGVKELQEKIKGKICFKSTVDMVDTLSSGTPEEVKDEARYLVESFNAPEGGFVCEVIRWHRPSYPDENVLASVEAFNEYRSGAPKG